MATTYSQKLKTFLVAEKALGRAIEKWEAAQSPDEVTAARVEAVRARETACDAFKELEECRRGYWLDVSKEAREELAKVAGPLIAKARVAAKNTYIVGAMVSPLDIVHELVNRTDYNKYEGSGNIPSDPVSSPNIDKSDDLWF